MWGATVSERKIYTPEHGVVILKDEDYVEVHRLEYQRFLENIRTINDIGEQWTRTTVELKLMTEDRDKWKKIAGLLVFGAEQQIDEWRPAGAENTNNAWLSAWHEYDEAVRGE